jgi:pilus assembly protein TadC
MAKLNILLISLFLYSCSAQYHLNKAIKKGYKCENTSDTIRITTLDSIPYIVNDTIVWEKFFTTKDTVIVYKNVYIPKPKWQVRTEIKYKYKIQLKTIYKDRIVEKAKARAEGKKSKNEVKLNRPKGNLNLLFVGVAIGLLLSWLWKYAIKSVI